MTLICMHYNIANFWVLIVHTVIYELSLSIYLSNMKTVGQALDKILITSTPIGPGYYTA